MKYIYYKFLILFTYYDSLQSTRTSDSASYTTFGIINELPWCIQTSGTILARYNRIRQDSSLSKHQTGQQIAKEVISIHINVCHARL